ncbi:hypothetical protein FHG87_019143 [Trinorchestia longiramus]|nr:hypothetical protein FHG87_019143 [Trinorchestia longiramus]
MGSSYQRLLSPWSKLQYITNREGPLSAPMGVEGNAWAQLGDGQDPTFPDVQFLIVSLSLSIDYGLVLNAAVGFKREIRILVDLPSVEQNFRDHPSIFGLSWNVRKGMGSSYQRLLSPWSKLQYVTNRKE